MKRRALLLAAPLLLPGLARGSSRALQPGPGVPDRSPHRAAGAMLWLHPHYTEGAPPDPPPFASRMTGNGWDLWRLDRIGTRDPLEEGAADLAAATASLRDRGYRAICVVGESRGAFIALTALRRPGLADSLCAIAPAAHGRRPERRAEALGAYRAALGSVAPDAVRRAALALFHDDPWDPDPGARAALFRDAMCARRIPALLIDRPAAPTGHGGGQDPDFDARFGARLAAFLDPREPAGLDC